MTKLMEWVSGVSVFLAIWASLVTRKFENDFTKANMTLILLLPVILVGLFGIYSVFIILYRVFTFNDCEEAAKELQKQIKEAKADLISKGITFTS